MKKGLKISIIVPLYNAEKIIDLCLESIIKQDYPIEEVIIIDNHSSDNSLKIATDFKKKNKDLKIKIVEREKTYGVSASYNLGAKLAKGDLVVTIHSDSSLPSKKELSLLVSPFFNDKSVVAAFPKVVHLKEDWIKYNFWQKCLFARAVGTQLHSMNGKFDCYKKDVFLRIGGYDEKKFNNSVGSEDADIHFRLEKEGKVIPTDAKVIHLHSFEENYSMLDWIARRKFLAVTYGRHLRLHAKEINKDIILFFIKPLLVFLILLVLINPLFLFIFLLFSFFSMPKMFTERSTVMDFRIVILPFVITFLIFYESFWMLESLLFRKIKI